MRSTNRLALVLLVPLLAVSLVFVAPTKTHAEQSGLTVTPAALTLNLAVGATDKSGTFTITNHYTTPVTLHFGVEPRPGVPLPNNYEPSSSLAVETTDVTIAPGETFRQTARLMDSEQLPPGSQLADLVITQSSTVDGHIGVLPSIRMPFTLIKQSGAVTKIGLTNASSPWFSLMLPNSLSATIANQGNMIAIPRGYVTIAKMDGTVVSKGVMNEASQAVSPGSSLTLRTPMKTLSSAMMPGMYRTTISYGLGADTRPVVATATFFYIAWWHVLLLIALVVGAIFGVRQLKQSRRRRPARAHGPPRKPALVGRDA